MDILEHIKHGYDGYNSTRKRIATFILENPTRCCFLSLKDFAKEAGSTEVTVLNFCRALDLGSYVELKKALQSYVLIWSRPTDRMDLLASRSATCRDLVCQVEKFEQRTLRETFERNDLERLRTFVDMIDKAQRIFVVAHRASRVLASFLSYRLGVLGVDITDLDVEDPHQIIYRFLGADPTKTLLIPIATPPYGSNTVATARMCRERSIPVAAITDSTLSPLVELSAVALICPTELMGLTNSTTSIMAIIDILAILLSRITRKHRKEPREDEIDEYEHFLSFFDPDE